MRDISRDTSISRTEAPVVVNNVSLDEAVAYLEVTKRQVFRYIKAGKLKPHYRKVKGRKGLYLYSNQVKDLYPTLRANNKAKDDAMDGFLALGEMIALGLYDRL